MSKKTMEDCRLVKKFGRPVQYNGLCEGFFKNEETEEPHDKCKECKFYYINTTEKEE